MPVKFWNLLLIVILLTGQVKMSKAQTSDLPRWSFEYSVAGTAVEIYALQALYKVSRYGQLMFGPCFQNYKNDQGRAHAYTFLLGYRHTYLKNITIEYELFPAYNDFRSAIDGKTHSGFEVYSELRPGYRFQFKAGTMNMYLLPQLTIGYGLWTNNKWPDFDKQPNPALMGNLWFGMYF